MVPRRRHNKYVKFKTIYLNRYVHLMYQISALTIYDITVTLLRHVSAWQYHCKGVHTQIKIIYSKMDYIYEFHSV